MSDIMESMKITELEQQIHYLRSATITLLLDLQVMLESGEYDEALEHLKGHTEPPKDKS